MFSLLINNLGCNQKWLDKKNVPIYKWIGRYSPSGTTRTKCMMGKRASVEHIAVNT